MNNIEICAKFKDNPKVCRWVGSDIYSDEGVIYLTAAPDRMIHINTKLCEWYIVKNPKWLREEK